MYYIIDLITFTVISGPHSLQDIAIKNRTQCGNPECLPNLADYGIVPEIKEAIDEDDDDYAPPVVTATAVTFAKATPTVAEIRRRKIERVKTICAAKEDNPVTVGRNTFSSARDARIVVIEALGHAERNPAGTVALPTRNGEVVVLTLDEVRAVVAAISTRVQACFANAVAKITALRAATTRAQLRAIDLQSGWPE